VAELLRVAEPLLLVAEQAAELLRVVEQAAVDAQVVAAEVRVVAAAEAARRSQTRTRRRSNLRSILT
jgi:hypothetical protein